jgi:hemolysin III
VSAVAANTVLRDLRSILPGRPQWRGRLHQVAFFVSLVTGALLVGLADPGRARIAAAIYAGSVSLLFATSAVYHRRAWTIRGRRWMSRVDHSMILVLMAGTFTPLALLLLPEPLGSIALSAVWAGAALGAALRMSWGGAPRWLVIAPYVAVSLVALVTLPALWEGGGPAVVLLLIVGGTLYLVGAAVLGLRRPSPSPLVFGYHEIFHALTLAAGTLFYVTSALAVWR